MADKGQSSDESLPNYNPEGIKLIDGYIELIKEDDPLAINEPENIGKIKLLSWRGHDYIQDTATDEAGVGWILAENWWPYQRPSFVTPPFAGYISGHSTFSRAASEVLTRLTGSEFFPGGMGEFIARKNEFLVFEEGPSVDVKLQWATYRDASDQTSLSRIWGGIHPPADDIPGRIIGAKVGKNAFNYALPYFNYNTEIDTKELFVYPNPVGYKEIYVKNTLETDIFRFFDITGKAINFFDLQYDSYKKETLLKLPEDIASGLYILRKGDLSKILVVSN